MIVLLMISSALLMIVPIKHVLHMFQQNLYESKRMMEWMKLEIKRNLVVKNLVPGVFLVIGCILSFFGNVGLALMSLITFIIALLLIRFERDKEYIKPLVLTARVKRQIVAMIILNTLWMIGFSFLPFKC